MWKAVIIILLSVFFVSGVSLAETKGKSGNPLPRFVTLKAVKAYMRTGPGRQYPIIWTFRRSGLPLEVVDEDGPWRRVRDHEGAIGWMHLRLLSNSRMAMISEGPVKLTDKPVPDSRVTIIAEQGVIGEILECEKAWCELEIVGESGWILRKRLWGVYKNEVID